MFNPQQVLEKKSTLFGIVFAVTIGILSIPIIFPHIFHGNHFLHILLHIGGISFAVFLTILSVFAYSRLKTKRLFLTALAFGIFFMAEAITLVDATWPLIFDIDDISLLELSHFFILCTLGLLAMGSFRND